MPKRRIIPIQDGSKIKFRWQSADINAKPKPTQKKPCRIRLKAHPPQKPLPPTAPTFPIQTGWQAISERLDYFSLAILDPTFLAKAERALTLAIKKDHRVKDAITESEDQVRKKPKGITTAKRPELAPFCKPGGTIGTRTISPL